MTLPTRPKTKLGVKVLAQTLWLVNLVKAFSRGLFVWWTSRYRYDIIHKVMLLSWLRRQRYLQQCPQRPA